jgi:hypothetical protein
MKSSFRFFLLPAVLGAFAWVGCKTEAPTSYVTSNGPSSSMVCDFENGLAVNPHLAEPSEPGNHVQTAGAVSETGAPMTIQIVPPGPGPDNTAHCAWLDGPVTTPAPPANNYQAVQFLIVPESAGTTLNGSPFTVYNASLFSGIQFYLKVMSDDTATVRSFSIPVLQTSNPPNGTCNPNAAGGGACYNNFEYVYSTTGGAWQLVTLPFSSFTRQNYGPALTPPTLSGANLEQIVSLQWSEGGNNVPGTVNVDFYVDQVQFF